MELLLLSSVSIGLLHAMAPDHWLPFVMMGRAQQWSRWRLTATTILAGAGHVLSSLAIGAAGVLLGIAVDGVNLFESSRGDVASLLLIGFGVAYMVWGLKNWGRHHTHDVSRTRAVTFWTLFALVVFGPCEPLIPLVFVGYGFGWHAVLAVAGTFGVTTIGMMLLQVHLATVGFSFLRGHWLEHASHVIAGATIALTGIAIRLL